MSPQRDDNSSGEEIVVSKTSLGSTSIACGDENPPLPVIVNVNGFDIPVPIASDDVDYKAKANPPDSNGENGEGSTACGFSRTVERSADHVIIPLFRLGKCE